MLDEQPPGALRNAAAAGSERSLFDASCEHPPSADDPFRVRRLNLASDPLKRLPGEDVISVRILGEVRGV